MILCIGKTKEHNNAINLDTKKLHSEERAAQLFVSGYGRRYTE